MLWFLLKYNSFPDSTKRGSFSNERLTLTFSWKLTALQSFLYQEKIIMFFTLQDSFLILTALFPGWKCRNSWNYSTQVQCQLTFQQLQKLERKVANNGKKTNNFSFSHKIKYIVFFLGRQRFNSDDIIFMLKSESARLIYTSSWNFRILFPNLVKTSVHHHVFLAGESSFRQRIFRWAVSYLHTLYSRP